MPVIAVLPVGARTVHARRTEEPRVVRKSLRVGVVDLELQPLRLVTTHLELPGVVVHHRLGLRHYHRACLADQRSVRCGRVRRPQLIAGTRVDQVLPRLSYIAADDRGLAIKLILQRERELLDKRRLQPLVPRTIRIARQ